MRSGEWLSLKIITRLSLLRVFRSIYFNSPIDRLIALTGIEFTIDCHHICHHIHDVRADFYHAAAELLQSCLLRLCRFLRCLQLPSRLRQGFLGTSKHRGSENGQNRILHLNPIPKHTKHIFCHAHHETNTMDSRSMNVLGIPAKRTNTSEGWSPELWGTNLWQQITPTICDMTILLAEHLVALPLLLEIRSSLTSQYRDHKAS